jgi:RNA polymerase sigma-70 factor (ECF subfamily)
MLAVDATSPEQDTEDLAAAAAAGDMDALGALYERYADDVRRVAVLALQGDRNRARDVSGKTWMQVGESIASYRYRPGAGFVAWLVTITRNKARDEHRKAYTRREDLTADMLLLDTADTADGPEEELLRAEQAGQVVAAVKRLTKDQQDVLKWRFWCNLSLAETADVMGRSPNAIGVLQHRALAALRRQLPAGVSDVGVGKGSRTPRRTTVPQRDAVAGEAGAR